jgi:hypothetical protein
MLNPFRELAERLHSAQQQPVTSAGIDDGRAGGDAEWPKQVKSRGIRVQPLTGLLGVALIAVLGIWGGAELQKRHGGTAAASSGFPAGAFANRGAGAGGRSGLTGAGGAAANFTVGTVTVISGKTLYLTSSSGAIVKVKLTSGTTFTRTTKAGKTSLKPGDTAIVQGAKNAAGTTVATSVAATAKGVTTSAGGFAGGFGARAGGNSTSGAGTTGG